MASRSISHYRVIKKLGAGGMGEVYLAEDTRLSRKVALKLLHPRSAADEHARKRLIREAKATAQLDHANICATYEVGVEGECTFIAMQYVEGETLAAIVRKGRLGIRESLDIATQIIDALSEAHSHGIIHRDIKPQNIIVTPHGKAKLMDFGLASLTDQTLSIQSEAETETLLTNPDSVVGTVPYMSPEQLKAESLDGRSDIFSFGAVLYQMITGRQPFAAKTNAETITAILTLDPAPLTRYTAAVPSELEKIVTKTLVKNRDSRYQTADDLLIDLRALRDRLELESRAEIANQRLSEADRDEDSYRVSPGKRLLSYLRHHLSALMGVASILVLVILMLMMTPSGGRAEIDSLAILPYSSAGDNPNLEYLSDGIAEGLIINLSRLPHLKVISRTSSFRYRPPETDPGEIGRRLKVKAVAIVRVTQIDDRLAISLELVDTGDSRQILGAQYVRRLSDIMSVQAEMSKLISEKLWLRLSGDEQTQVTRRHTQNVDAYQLYLQGRFHYHKLTQEGVNRSIDYYKRAVAEDDRFALAHAGLSLAYTMLGANYVPPRQVMDEARFHAMKALELDDTLAEAHLALADIKYAYDWDWSGSESEFKRALDLDQNYASAYQGYGYLLETMNRVPESIRMMQRAVALDPLSLIAHMNLANAYHYGGEDDQAVAGYRKALELDPSFHYASLSIANIFALRGRAEEAVAVMRGGGVMPAQDPLVRAGMAQIYARTGRSTEARRILNSLIADSHKGYVRPYDVASVCAALGEKDQAFEWLERSIQDRSSWILKLAVDPQFDNLRNDAKFQDLLRRIGLTR